MSASAAPGLTLRRVEHLAEPEIAALVGLLVAVVAEGASVGFLPPLDPGEAAAYWRGAVGPGVVLLVAELGGAVAGTVQVRPAESANGRHRGEVCKLLVGPAYRRRGIARALLDAAGATARAEGMTLLTLDTREDDPSSALYRSAGYVEAGRIPDWARDAEGCLRATVFYYKSLGPEEAAR